ncbi:hypothetical protein PC128_g8241 [Phytophthora cactorum]|nr:hypothetical protein PC128_g8241 [Phytophthora cactorum]
MFSPTLIAQGSIGVHKIQEDLKNSPNRKREGSDTTEGIGTSAVASTAVPDIDDSDNDSQARDVRVKHRLTLQEQLQQISLMA